MPGKPRVPKKGKGTAPKRAAPHPARTDRPYARPYAVQLAEHVHAAARLLLFTCLIADGMRVNPDDRDDNPDDSARARLYTPIRDAMLQKLKAMLDASRDVALDKARRLALMSHLDRCLLASDPKLEPLAEVIAEGGMVAISVEDVAALLPAWGQRKGGAKPSDGSKGRRPKWDALAELLTARWGDTTSPESLRHEHKDWRAQLEAERQALATIDPSDDAT